MVKIAMVKIITTPVEMKEICSVLSSFITSFSG